MLKNKRIVVGVSGASGSLLAIDFLKQLKRLDNYESHVIITTSARRTLEHEIPEMPDCLDTLADFSYDPDDIGARVASGSFPIDGMVVIPCSMKTLAGINIGYSDNLLLRAADVTIKEHRPLVLCVRESPFSTIHLRNMQQLAEIGVHILPPMMSFYSRQETVEEMVRHHTGKILDLFHEEAENYIRWEQG